MMSEYQKKQENERPNLIGDLWFVIRRERKWWLIPLIVILFGIIGLTLLAGSAGPLAPFLYPLM